VEKQIKITLPDSMIKKMGGDMKSRSDLIKEALKLYWSQKKGGKAENVVVNNGRNSGPIVWNIPGV